ncbi:MAG: T9SS type A sorting domain-containing protein [Bacteroidales bacterium]|nr:T9SS type A sorting domain-containing protein [Bacteroidales bacterium]
MKKLLLSAIVGFMAFSVLIAQNLTLTTLEGNPVPANSVLVLEGNPSDLETVAYVNITNNNSYEVDLRVKKVENFLTSGSECQFCLGLCYPPFVYESTQPFPLGAGATTANEDFSGHYLPAGNAGLSSVSYVFYDFNNPGDSILFTVNYDVTDMDPTLSLSWEGGNLEDNSTVEFSGNPDVMAIASYIYVTNNDGQPVDVHVKRIVTHVLPGTVNYFCWGACFPPDVNQSINPITIGAGATNSTDFIGDLEPNGQAGISYISYVFFDASDASNYSTVNVQYNTMVTGIDDFQAVEPSVIAYPNPANNFVNIDYDNLVNQNARIVIYDLLGSVVKEINVTDNNGSIKNINTSTLNEGIYFYSLVINNESKDTQKLIIKH